MRAMATLSRGSVMTVTESVPDSFGVTLTQLASTSTDDVLDYRDEAEAWVGETYGDDWPHSKGSFPLPLPPDFCDDIIQSYVSGRIRALYRDWPSVLGRREDVFRSYSGRTRGGPYRARPPRPGHGEAAERGSQVIRAFVSGWGTSPLGDCRRHEVRPTDSIYLDPLEPSGAGRRDLSGGEWSNRHLEPMLPEGHVDNPDLDWGHLERRIGQRNRLRAVRSVECFHLGMVGLNLYQGLVRLHGELLSSGLPLFRGAPWAPRPLFQQGFQEMLGRLTHLVYREWHMNAVGGISEPFRPSRSFTSESFACE